MDAPNNTSEPPPPPWSLADAIQGLDAATLKRLGIQPPDWPIFDLDNAPENDEPGDGGRPSFDAPSAPPPSIAADTWSPMPEPAPQGTRQGTSEGTWQGTSAESGDTFQDVKKMCSATTRAGRPCNARPRLGRDRCIFHDPDFAAAHRASSARGGRHRPPPPPDYQTLIVNIDDRASLQAVIESVLRLQLYGQIPLRRSGHILRTLALAARNFDPPNFVPQEGYRQILHSRSYIGARETIHAALPQIVDALKLDEVSDRAAGIEDARARRYEVRQVDELFGTTQPRKTAG